jgi:transposase, IS30 family
VIADLRAAKVTVRGIAAQLGRSPSTISREIRRNSDPDGRYRPHHAEHAARLRACKPRKRRVAIDVVLADVVAWLLAKRWSPEQIAHELRDLFVGQRQRWLCAEWSTKRSMTRQSPSPVRHAGVVAADVCSACSDAGG